MKDYGGIWSGGFRRSRDLVSLVVTSQACDTRLSALGFPNSYKSLSIVTSSLQFCGFGRFAAHDSAARISPDHRAVVLEPSVL